MKSHSSTLNQVKANDRVVVLDSLRGIAALLVVWVHFSYEFFQGSIWTFQGQIGVQVFFVISGFVIPYSLQRSGYCAERQFFRFLAKRLVRLHPPFLASMLFAIGLAWLADHLVRGANFLRAYSAKSVVENAFLLVPIFHQKWLMAAYWTLAVEFQWYLSVAVCFGCIAKNARRRWFYIVAVSGCLLSLAWPQLRHEYLPEHLPLFVMGLVVFRRKLHCESNWATFLLLGAAYGCGLHRLGAWAASAGLLTSIAILFVSRTLPIFHAIGAFSYSLYLLHTPILFQSLYCLRFRFLDPFLGQSGEKCFRMFVGIGISIVTAWIVGKLIEEPFQKLASRIRFSKGQPDSAHWPSPIRSAQECTVE